jgi:transposase-like protein
MEAKTVAKLLVEEVIVTFGTPYVIHTDQGVQFESTCFRRCVDYCKYRKLGLLPTILSQMGSFATVFASMLGIAKHSVHLV